jgi:tetratricopeptide (TPR) repeat protein
MTNSPAPQDLAEQANRSYRSGDYPGAADGFARAAAAFRTTGDELMAAEMLNNQSVALLRAKVPAQALEVVRGTDELFAKAGDFRRQGMALANQASACEALKQYPQAIEYFRKAGDVLEKAGEGDLRAQVMQLLSMHYLRRFKFYESVIALQSSLAGVKNPTPKQRLMKKILFMRMRI